MFYAIRYLSPLASLVAFFLRRNRDPSACRTRLSIDPAIDPALMRHVRDQSATERRGRKSRRVCSGVGNQKHFPILVYGYVTRGCGLSLTPPSTPLTPCRPAGNREYSPDVRDGVADLAAGRGGNRRYSRKDNAACPPARFASLYAAIKRPSLSLRGTEGGREGGRAREGSSLCIIRMSACALRRRHAASAVYL
jgi:hypothetical protein